MFRFRRVVGAALEDFGLRRPQPAAEPVTEAPPEPVPEPEMPTATEAGPATAPEGGVIWHGSARRSLELQRFCDHLASRRDAAPALHR